MKKQLNDIKIRGLILIVSAFSILLALSCTGPSARDTRSDAPLDEFIHHDFLVGRYDSMHWSPLQEKYRKIQPIPVGVVYMHKGEEEAEVRETFRTMKRLGFTGNKQILGREQYSMEELMLMALEEGLIPWWYGEGGWEEITDSLLTVLGIPVDTPIEQVRTDQRMIDYQTGVLKKRILNMIELNKKGRYVGGGAVAFIEDVGGKGIDLTDKGKELYAGWLKKKYPGAGKEEISRMVQNPDVKNVLRFKADKRLEYTREMVRLHHELEPDAPFRAGGEMSLFLPHAYYGVDMEGIADIMKDAGSFYPSIHLTWHFEEVNYEIVRPVYMQASFAADLFKGGWSAAWESTGGPQQFDGWKEGNGFTVDEGVMTQLMYSYMAGGFKGFGFWCWSNHPKGGGPGEYGMVDRYKQVTPRAIKVGQIGQAAIRYRDEIWKAHKEPLVGIYYDWDNEANWAALSVRQRDKFRLDPVCSRIGVCRALINANVPFEFVTATDLRKNLAMRYKIIYLPFLLEIPEDVMEILSSYVENGGRLVMDLPGAYRSRTNEGTAFHNTFGVTITDYQFAGVNRPYRIGELELSGFTCDTKVANAKVIASYSNGKPAILENKSGKGTAVLLGYEASMMCFKPGNEKAEQMLVDYTLGDYESPYACTDAIVYRIAAPGADHYFLINDGEARSVILDTKKYRYKSLSDPVTGEVLKIGAPVPLEAYGGRWLRFEKSGQ